MTVMGRRRVAHRRGLARMGRPVTAPAPTPATPAPSGARRVTSLDVARGLMLVVSVAVNAWYTAPAWFEHAPWDGVHPVDLVFPTFVTLSGCGLGFAYRRRVPVGPTVRRVLVLLAVGMLYNAYTQYLTTGSVAWASFHVFGVLQLYAFVVLAVALLHLVLRTWWAWAAATVALGLAYTAWLHLAAAGCAGGVLVPFCNPSWTVDPAVAGVGHIYHQGRYGHDPEGVASMLGALVTASAGCTIGHVLTLDRRPRVVAAIGSAVVATFALAAWWAGSQTLTMKRLWTPPFGLGVAAAVGLVLVLLYLMLDTRRSGRLQGVLTYPLVALGRNSLLVYFGSHVLMLTLLLTYPGGDRHGESWAQVLTRHVAVGPLTGHDALAFCGAAVLAWTGLAMLLHWRRIYLRP